MSKRIALVTGAGSGIGRACAIALAEDGWDVVLTGRRASALHETVSEAGEAGGNMLVEPADVTDPAAVEKLFAEIAKVHGCVDMVFNNAGSFGKADTVGDMSWENWRSVVGVNLDGRHNFTAFVVVTVGKFVACRNCFHTHFIEKFLIMMGPGTTDKEHSCFAFSAG